MFDITWQTLRLVGCDKNIEVNFNERILILVNKTTGGMPIVNRKIFTNPKEIIYIAEIERTSSTEENSGLIEQISIPKVNNINETNFIINEVNK